MTAPSATHTERPSRPRDRLHSRTGEACPEGVEGTPVLNEVTEGCLRQAWPARTCSRTKLAALRVMGREVVTALTHGRLDGFALLTRTFETRERLLYGEPDGRRRKRVLAKIIGE